MRLRTRKQMTTTFNADFVSHYLNPLAFLIKILLSVLRNLTFVYLFFLVRKLFWPNKADTDAEFWQKSSWNQLIVRSRLRLKVRQNRNDFFKPTFPPKNEQTNSILLLWDLFLFVFWRKLKTPKRYFVINWPLGCGSVKIQRLNHRFGLKFLLCTILTPMILLSFICQSGNNTSFVSFFKGLQIGFFGKINGYIGICWWCMVFYQTSLSNGSILTPTIPLGICQTGGSNKSNKSLSCKVRLGYRASAIITRGLYIFYPIFQCGL